MADEWAPPRPIAFYTADSSYSFTVIPRMTEQDSCYYSNGEGVWGQKIDTSLIHVNPTCKGILVKRTSNAKDSICWSKQLINAVAPVGVHVFGNGSNVVTFDNWHSVGLGSAVIVVYDKDGELLKAYSLESFLPVDVLNKLSVSISSRWWKQDYEVDEANMILQFSSKLFKRSFWGYKEFIDTFRLDLETGRLVERGQRMDK